MNHKHMSGLIIVALLFAGCGGKKADVGEGEKKLADTQKQLEEAKSQPGAEQKARGQRERGAGKRKNRDDNVGGQKDQWEPRTHRRRPVT